MIINRTLYSKKTYYNILKGLVWACISMSYQNCSKNTDKSAGNPGESLPNV